MTQAEVRTVNTWGPNNRGIAEHGKGALVCSRKLGHVVFGIPVARTRARVNHGDPAQTLGGSCEEWCNPTMGLVIHCSRTKMARTHRRKPAAIISGGLDMDLLSEFCRLPRIVMSEEGVLSYLELIRNPASVSALAAARMASAASSGKRAVTKTYFVRA